MEVRVKVCGNCGYALTPDNFPTIAKTFKCERAMKWTDWDHVCPHHRFKEEMLLVEATPEPITPLSDLIVINIPQEILDMSANVEKTEDSIT